MPTEKPMQLGMVGLGRMGANIVRRLTKDGHVCVAHDASPDAVRSLESEGVRGASSMAQLVSQLDRPRAVWIMVPAGDITTSVVNELAELLDRDDVIVDGGNSYYRDDIRRAEQLSGKGIHYVDCGTSGGVWGLERGYCLMIGGEQAPVQRLAPIFASLAPGVDAAERTPGRKGAPADSEKGYLHCGPSGAGHFVKMVHNGIEYGMMASLAEGLNILHRADAGLSSAHGDAETAPLEEPEYYRYQLDIPEIAEVWRRGSVIGSWLLDLTASAFEESPDLAGLEGRVSDSGEGRWTSIAAIDEGIPAPVLTAALYARFASRGLDDFANKVLSAMRREFGGHEEVLH